jgi:hypothetical protein
MLRLAARAKAARLIRKPSVPKIGTLAGILDDRCDAERIVERAAPTGGPPLRARNTWIGTPSPRNS